MDNLVQINKEFNKKTPEDIVEWAFAETKNPILTTNFRPYEVAILHLCTKLMPKLKIVWCDSGYNTKATYLYAEKIINTYVKNRHSDEVFIDCVSRIGLEPFKEEVYGKKEKSA